jgi:ATPase subunit of ABC transporter with duplicated ATPase domains
MLAARNLTVVRGAQVVLEGVDLVVDGTSRIGVLGRNGAGKTTLLRFLAGLETPTSGTVERSPPALNVGYLAQEPDPRPGETTAAYLRRRTGLAPAEAAMQAALRAVGDHPGTPELEAYDDALARFLALGGDDHDTRAPRLLADVGLDPAVLDTPLARLSGGQRVKAGLAAILLARFDVLLLDEPTNNLDFDGLARLERSLAGEDRPVVLISHDRAFLSATTTRIAELDLRSRR